MSKKNYKYDILKTFKNYELRIYNSEGRLQFHTYVGENIYKMSENEQMKYIQENFSKVLDDI